MTNNIPEAEVVFVHLGPELPSHVDCAVAQARTASPRVSLVLDRPDDEARRFPGTRLVDAAELLPLDERSTYARSSGLDGDFRGGFWLLSLLRLIVLGRYASSRPWPVLH